MPNKYCNQSHNTKKLLQRQQYSSAIATLHIAAFYADALIPDRFKQSVKPFLISQIAEEISIQRFERATQPSQESQPPTIVQLQEDDDFDLYDDLDIVMATEDSDSTSSNENIDPKVEADCFCGCCVVSCCC